MYDGDDTMSVAVEHLLGQYLNGEKMSMRHAKMRLEHVVYTSDNIILCVIVFKNLPSAGLKLNQEPRNWFPGQHNKNVRIGSQ